MKKTECMIQSKLFCFLWTRWEALMKAFCYSWSWSMTQRQRQARRNSLLPGDKSRIVCAPPLPQCSHCHVCLAHGAAVYQLIKISPLQLQTSANQCLQKGVQSQQNPAYFSLRSNPTCDWQQGHTDLTVHHSGSGVCCTVLQSPGHPLTRHSHLALLILPIPLHDRGDPVHITRLSRDHSPRRTSITHDIITVISVPSSSTGRERIQLERTFYQVSLQSDWPRAWTLHVPLVYLKHWEWKTFWATKRRILMGMFSWQQCSK